MNTVANRDVFEDNVSTWSQCCFVILILKLLLGDEVVHALCWRDICIACHQGSIQ